MWPARVTTARHRSVITDVVITDVVIATVVSINGAGPRHRRTGIAAAAVPGAALARAAIAPAQSPLASGGADRECPSPPYRARSETVCGPVHGPVYRPAYGPVYGPV
jgi:hypothetical protein